LAIGRAEADATVMARAILAREIPEADPDGVLKIHVRALYRRKSWSGCATQSVAAMRSTC
jgi:hypothetical protein